MQKSKINRIDQIFNDLWLQTTKQVQPRNEVGQKEVEEGVKMVILRHENEDRCQHVVNVMDHNLLHILMKLELIERSNVTKNIKQKELQKERKKRD